jgi:hypothetical protein
MAALIKFLQQRRIHFCTETMTTMLSRLTAAIIGGGSAGATPPQPPVAPAQAAEPQPVPSLAEAAQMAKDSIDGLQDAIKQLDAKKDQLLKKRPSVRLWPRGTWASALPPQRVSLARLLLSRSSTTSAAAVLKPWARLTPIAASSAY